MNDIQRLRDALSGLSDGGIIEGFVVGFCQLSPEGNAELVTIHDLGGSTPVQLVGLCEMAKFDIMMDNRIGPADNWRD